MVGRVPRDWDDERCRAILRYCARAMPGTAGAEGRTSTIGEVARPRLSGEELVSNMHADPEAGLPERMTWEELSALPEELARQSELHSGRVVFSCTGPPRHQRFFRRTANAIESCAREATAVGTGAQQYWQVDVETNVFFNGDKSDFRTPDFLVYRCQDSGEDDVHAHDVVLAGEVLSPANTHDAIETKKAKYAGAGIPWYWEVDLLGDAIAAVRSYALELSTVLPAGVVPLRPRNYILVGEWTRSAGDPGISTAHPFPMNISWQTLAF